MSHEKLRNLVRATAKAIYPAQFQSEFCRELWRLVQLEDAGITELSDGKA